MQTDCFPDSNVAWPKSVVSAIADVDPKYVMEEGLSLPFVEMASVGENFAGILRVESRKLHGSGHARFKEGDTLFAKITPCSENGKIAFVSQLPSRIGIGSTEFVVLSPRQGTDPRFLFHLMCSYAFRGRACARMEGSTGRQRVPRDVFTKRLLVPSPPPWEQVAIARVLDVVSNAIERTQDVIHQTQMLERSVLSAVFRSLDTEPRSLGEFIEDIKYGTSKPSNEKERGNAVLRVPNVTGSCLALDDVAYVDIPVTEVKRLQLRDGDLLLVRTNGNPRFVGRSVVFRRPDARTWVFASYLVRVRTQKRLNSDYVNIFLGLEEGRRELLRRITTSAGNYNINTNSIRLVQLPVPRSRDAQMKIVDISKGFRQLVNNLESKRHSLVRLRQSLMHDLLTGKVRAPEIEQASRS